MCRFCGDASIKFDFNQICVFSTYIEIKISSITLNLNLQTDSLVNTRERTYGQTDVTALIRRYSQFFRVQLKWNFYYGFSKNCT
jgi:hypothetical protein